MKETCEESMRESDRNGNPIILYLVNVQWESVVRNLISKRARAHGKDSVCTGSPKIHAQRYLIFFSICCARINVNAFNFNQNFPERLHT